MVDFNFAAGNPPFCRYLFDALPPPLGTLAGGALFLVFCTSFVR